MDSKQKRYVYEKAFSVEGVIQNLKTYQVASGDLLPSALCTKGERQRDEMRSYVGETSGSSVQEQRPKKEYSRRKRRRRRDAVKNKRSKVNIEVGRIGESSGDGTASALSRVPCEGKDAVTGSLALLASHYSNSESEEEEQLFVIGDGNCVSQTSAVSKEKSSSSRPPESLRVPDVILEMYAETSDKDGSSSEGEREQSRSATHLGFFESVHTDGEEEGKDKSVGIAIPKGENARWDAAKAKWKFPASNLQSYICANCNKVGHFTQDCTVGSSSQKPAQVPATLKNLYTSARKMASHKDIHCAECGLSSNLVCCLECRSVYCDGLGHLSMHLRSYPTHVKLYSCKLRKLVKCCKSTCEVVSVYDLLVCSHCLSKAFSHHYSMVTACWSGAGLRKIQNAIACEDHFHWHRMNCSSSNEENFISKEKLQCKIISEFFF